MYLINTTTLELRQFLGTIPPYVILSHTWGDDEVTFDTIQNLNTMTTRVSEGYQKIKKCCERAKQDGYKWAWVDTCCIDKRSSAELSEAINSMYRYYYEADKCYAYLSDVCVKHEPNVEGHMATCSATERLPVPPENWSESSARRLDLPLLPWPKDQHHTSLPSSDDIGKLLTGSRWFTRGWTLQELLAPAVVEFYDMHWTLLGTKSNLATEVEKIAKIRVSYLRNRENVRHASLGLRFSWASKRQTTRAEDIAYCLLGIVGVNMPLLYGEGKRAFRRLQVELFKQTRDHSMFAWSTFDYWTPGLPAEAHSSQSFLAPSPACFQPDFLYDVISTSWQTAKNSVLEMTALGLHIILPCIKTSTQGQVIAILDCIKGYDTCIGVLLLDMSDGFYRRTDAALEKVSIEQRERAVSTEIYIVEKSSDDLVSMEDSRCAFKADIITMEGLSKSDVCGYTLDTFTNFQAITSQGGQLLTTSAEVFCDEIVEVSLRQAVVFTIKLRTANITVFSRDDHGQFRLKVMLTDDEMTREEALRLIESFWLRRQSVHPQDNATVSRGTELRVDLHARKTLLDRQEYMVPCWQLAIHICAGSATLSSR